MTEPDQAHASFATSSAAPRRGRNSYDGDGPQDTFRIRFGRRDESDDGDTYYQFHPHYQIRQPFRDDGAWTWLSATRTLPDGRFDPSPYDDSRTRLLRDPVHWKPYYYAHFKALKVKPGSLITFWGRWHYKAPVPVPGGTDRRNLLGSCVAWLNT